MTQQISEMPSGIIIHDFPDDECEATAGSGVVTEEAGTFKFRGRVLHPFTSSRRGIFGEMRLAVGAPSLKACMDDVNAFHADAWRILFLCSHEPDEWAAVRCSPLKFQILIDEWSDIDGVGDAVEVVLLGYQIFAAVVGSAPAAVGAS